MLAAGYFSRRPEKRRLLPVRLYDSGCVQRDRPVRQGTFRTVHVLSSSSVLPPDWNESPPGWDIGYFSQPNLSVDDFTSEVRYLNWVLHLARLQIPYSATSLGLSSNSLTISQASTCLPRVFVDSHLRTSNFWKY